jgi:hypothetical protein
VLRAEHVAAESQQLLPQAERLIPADAGAITCIRVLLQKMTEPVTGRRMKVENQSDWSLSGGVRDEILPAVKLGAQPGYQGATAR